MRVKPDRHAKWYVDLEALGRRIVQAFPALEPLLQENLQDHGEFLFHLFMLRVTEKIVQSHLGAADDEFANLDVRAFIAFLDVEAGMGAGSRNEIAVGFVENLPYPGEPGSDLHQLLGPNLAEFREV